MAIFSFGKKKEEMKESYAPGNPLDLVMAMKQRGIGNDQIIQELERQGYGPSQIFDALNHANLTGADAAFPQSPGIGMPPPMQDFSQQQPYATQQFEERQFDKEQVEEIVEAIIDEKWKEFERDIKIIIDWKEKTESKIDHMDQQVRDITNSLNSLHKSLMGKISEYDRNITDVGTEIKAMEKVFQKVLPSLTENVNKLDRMTKDYKMPASGKER